MNKLILVGIIGTTALALLGAPYLAAMFVTGMFTGEVIWRACK